MFHNRPDPVSAALNKKSIIVAFLLTAVTAAMYCGVLKNDFAYYDDESYITANTHIKNGLSWSGVTWAFSSIGYSDNWHPLTWLSHMLDIQLFGLDPAGHHATNLLFHILAMLLLFGFLYSSTGLLWPSALVGALFGLHPLHVESVAWVAERKDVLCAVFWFATLWVYVRYVRRPTVATYLLVFMLCALGLLAKPMLVTMPFILLLLDYWPLERLTFSKRPSGRLLAEKIPFVLLSIVSSVITLIAQHEAIGSLQKITLATRFSNAVTSYCVYLWQALWPVNLSVFYSYPLPQPAPTILCFLLLAVMTVIVIVQGGKKKYLVTGWLWYAASLVPVAGIVQVGSQAHADRYTYIPLTGIFIMALWSLNAIAGRMTLQKKLLAGAALSVVFISMGIQTMRQVGYWKNGMTLFAHGFDVTKGKVNENIYYNFGNLLSQAGRTDEAAFYYREALEINPRHARSHINLGILLADRGQSEKAMGHYLKALEQGPSAEAHNNLGTLLAKMGRTDEASVHFLKALEINPGYGDAHYNFGYMFETMGRYEDALTHYRKAMELNPGDAGVYFNSGVLLSRMGRTDEAIAHFRKALELDPKNAGTHNNLGTLLADKGQTDEAIAQYQKALELDPDATFPLQNLASAYAQKGQRTEAVSMVRKALAAATAAGDTARAKTIAQIFKELTETVDSSGTNLKTHALQ
jgi:protein O-mannosyl-transferase